ncbi:hypothetical protein JOB18_025051 [Solea senegalensis]|uniref:Uncharacterized protein n=1 Tax=Solea senegalensis TaxID=28829 RepID=A0AAV6PS71_SOLSE|nr:hypothetical protein JOB18_025051 [Solea senegalensis]
MWIIFAHRTGLAGKKKEAIEVGTFQREVLVEPLAKSFRNHLVPQSTATTRPELHGEKLKIYTL